MAEYPPVEIRFVVDSEEFYRRQADRTRTVTIEAYLKTAPRWLRVALTRSMMRFHKVEWEHDSDDLPTDVPNDKRQPARLFAEAELVASRIADAGDEDGDPLHYLVLDVDQGCVHIHSSTPGHSHLIFNTMVSEEGLHEILDVLAKHGVIEKNYAAVSKARPEGAFLRLPWIRKGLERWDALAALTWWVNTDEADVNKLINDSPDSPW